MGLARPDLQTLDATSQSLMDTVVGNFASVIDLNETLHEETGLWVIEPERYKRRVSR